MKYSSIAVLAFVAVAGVAQAGTIFNNIPGSLAPNYASLGYEATSTQEFGDKITFGGGGRELTAATVTMSDWARASDYAGVGDATGYDHDLTINIYAAGAGDAVGPLLGTKTQTFHMLWRPENNPGDNSVWIGPDSQPYHGIAFNCTFDLTSLGLTSPDTIIYGLSYNTADYGVSPIHAPGPYNSLNFGLGGVTTVGTDVDPDSAYWNTSFAGNYTDGGLGGVGTFRKDTNWLPYAPMVNFQAVPEPASMAALGLGVLALIKKRRNR